MNGSRPRFSARGLLVALAVLAACTSDPRGHATRAVDLVRVTLEHTTPSEVEHLFGPPDERPSDGSLVYHGVHVGEAAAVGAGVFESVTFRFTNGVLSRICRSRS